MPDVHPVDVHSGDVQQVHVHQVLVKLADPATLLHCRTAMESMEGRVPGMLSLLVTENICDDPRSAELSLTTRFVDTAAYEYYRDDDPVHAEVSTVVRSLMSEALSLDWVEPG